MPYIDIFSNSNNSFLFTLFLSINLYSFPVVQDMYNLYNNLGGNKELVSLLSPSIGGEKKHRLV